MSDDESVYDMTMANAPVVEITQPKKRKATKRNDLAKRRVKKKQIPDRPVDEAYLSEVVSAMHTEIADDPEYAEFTHRIKSIFKPFVAPIPPQPESDTDIEIDPDNIDDFCEPYIDDVVEEEDCGVSTRELVEAALADLDRIRVNLEHLYNKL